MIKLLTFGKIAGSFNYLPAGFQLLSVLLACLLNCCIFYKFALLEVLKVSYLANYA